MKRHLMKDLPESDDDIAQWCRDIFIAKVLLFSIRLFPFITKERKAVLLTLNVIAPNHITRINYWTNMQWITLSVMNNRETWVVL